MVCATCRLGHSPLFLTRRHQSGCLSPGTTVPQRLRRCQINMGSPDCGSDCPFIITCLTLVVSHPPVLPLPVPSNTPVMMMAVLNVPLSLLSESVARPRSSKRHLPGTIPFTQRPWVSDNTRSGFWSHNHEIEKEITEDAAL